MVIVEAFCPLSAQAGPFLSLQRSSLFLHPPFHHDPFWPHSPSARPLPPPPRVPFYALVHLGVSFWATGCVHVLLIFFSFSQCCLLLESIDLNGQTVKAQIADSPSHWRPSRLLALAFQDLFMCIVAFLDSTLRRVGRSFAFPYT